MDAEGPPEPKRTGGAIEPKQSGGAIEPNQTGGGEGEGGVEGVVDNLEELAEAGLAAALA